jgi:hypothetical protein
VEELKGFILERAEEFVRIEVASPARRGDCSIYLLGLRVAGDDELKGPLTGGGARPPLRDPVDLEPIGVLAFVFVPADIDGSLIGFESLFESFFLILPNILIFDDDGGIL